MKEILPQKYIRDFIRGYFDGDGGVSYTSLQMLFCGNEKFLSSIKYILEENGIKVSELKYDNRSKAVNIYIYGIDNIDKFKNYIYKDNCVNLSRKFDKFFFIKNNPKLYINRQV